MQLELEQKIQKTRERIQERQKQVDLLQCQADNAICCGNTALAEADNVFALIARLVERTKTEAKEDIRSQQEAEEHKLKELQDKVQEEIITLKAKYNKLEKLSHSEDHSGFIRTFPFLSEVDETPDSEPSICEERPPMFLDVITSAVAELREKLQDTNALNQAAGEEQAKHNTTAWLTFPPINYHGQSVRAYQQQLHAMQAQRWLILRNVRTLRAELLYYAQSLTLDPNTVHCQLALSADNNTVRFMSSEQEHVEHPERFTHFSQVLTKEVLTGRCYMEIKARSEEYFTVAVAYKDMRREGLSDECSLGNNTKSWAVDCFSDGFVFWHNKRSLNVRARPSNKIGIYVDVEAGVLCFYSVGREASLIHTVHTSFTEPLLAGIWLKDAADCAEICSITPR
uniref:B30.2/SPRY domain-containing protein n=1 Tax=Knipowitschia caucasica TaxID=637954 RepID=A0AAV2KW81_KNICA